MSTSAPEYLTTLREGFADAVQTWLDQSSTAWDQWTQAWTPLAEAGAGALGMPWGGAAGPSAGRGRSGTGHHAHGHHHHDHPHGPGGHHAGHDHPHGSGHHAGHDCGCGEPGHHGAHDCGCGEPGHHGAHDCGCARATGCCESACDCCVPDADVVVKARAGEVRVVPFRLHNPWRREREVTLEVGPWHRCFGPGLDVRARLEETRVVLAPCEDRVVRLLVTARGTSGEGDNGKDTAPGDQPTTADTRAATLTVEDLESARAVAVDTRGGRDVDSCASGYADVRFEGCARPQRVALVVLPVDCEPVEVGCDCGCCC